MSEYQYYEFCSLTEPLSQGARKEMESLSSRASITTHGAFYVYNFGGKFRGDPKKLLLKYFDIFFYIANWGTVQLMFKFLDGEMDMTEVKKYLMKDVISCKRYKQGILLDIVVHNEDGFGWTEGEGLLPLLLPLHSEIKNKNYQVLNLALEANQEFTGDEEFLLTKIKKKKPLSTAQKTFIKTIGL